jgi:predicted nucleotidyltransferase
MDVKSPISSVIPSLDGPVLETLAAVRVPMSLTEIYRRCSRGSLPGVRLALGRLVISGVVHEVSGRYLLNRDHLAASAVETLATLHGHLVERIGSEVDSWNFEIAVVGLFGSAARRDGDSSSDIDVLIVSDEKCPDELVTNLAENIELWTGNRAQMLSLTTQDIYRLVAAREPILTNWEHDLEVIRGSESAIALTGVDA